MFQSIVDSISISNPNQNHQELNPLCVYALSDGTLVTGFEISVFDSENENLSSLETQLREFVRSLPTNILARIILITDKDTELFDLESSSTHSREAAVRDLGFVCSKAYLFFEQNSRVFSSFFSPGKTAFENEAKIFLSAIKLNELFATQAILSPLGLEDFLALLSPSKTHPHRQPITLGNCYMDFGSHIEGVCKLIKQSTYEISVLTLAQIKDQLPLPNKIVLTIRNQSSQKTETWLRRKSNQAETGTGAISQSKYEKVQIDLEKIMASGARVLSIELQVVLQRYSEGQLRKDADYCIHTLKGLGEFYFETIGVRPAWFSAQIGGVQHVPFLEIDEVVPSYMPLFSLGHSHFRLRKDGIQKSSLLLHRRDDSVGVFELFNKSYDSFSTCIFGAPGSGKSVLTNMITRALAHDENIFITKLDVGGSHSRETSLLGGREFCFSIDTPTGHNPFSYLKKSSSSELIQILGAFLEILMKEEGETSLSKAMKSDIERCLCQYQELQPKRPCIDDFLLQSKDLPRRKLLERWSSSGIYKNAFMELDNPTDQQSFFDPSVRLKYFNFAKISQALDSDFSQGGLAAVMSAFNFDMLVNRQNRRFVFIADEVPVFIQKCFSFFALSIANIRKNGDAFITIAQRSEHVVVDQNTSILDNSPSKFIFTVDGAKENFAKRLHLPGADVDEIENLKRAQGRYSEVFHMDQLGKRVYRIVLSPTEYWSYTSKREDKDKLEALMKIPGFSLKQAIECLTI